jgi:hypothetical protein
MRLLRYLAGLSAARLILWGYLCWYLTIVALYFDPHPGLWLSSLGISAIVGFALILSTDRAAHWPPTWVTFRLFLMPFCVSSYAALIKGRDFFLLFPTKPRELLLCAAACAGFLLLHAASRALVRRQGRDEAP